MATEYLKKATRIALPASGSGFDRRDSDLVVDAAATQAAASQVSEQLKDHLQP